MTECPLGIDFLGGHYFFVLLVLKSYISVLSLLEALTSEAEDNYENEER